MISSSFLYRCFLFSVFGVACFVSQEHQAFADVSFYGPFPPPPTASQPIVPPPNGWRPPSIRPPIHHPIYPPYPRHGFPHRRWRQDGGGWQQGWGGSAIVPEPYPFTEEQPSPRRLGRSCVDKVCTRD
ncbi:hypothetical protein GT348_09050 (plasmid) [Aristophania vespae]|uniref:Uncharacterized protein n=1 Tax=Aristophania vespae TaxID=2697033 RepID=A0A6P1NIX6_9PROT|nr:hypothetical protein [Aristophania vespae]QHI96494.1 hypothetical protein GT348_09050 [Aristophania vespae]